MKFKGDSCWKFVSYDKIYLCRYIDTNRFRQNRALPRTRRIIIIGGGGGLIASQDDSIYNNMSSFTNKVLDPHLLGKPFFGHTRLDLLAKKWLPLHLNRVGSRTFLVKLDILYVLSSGEATSSPSSSRSWKK